MTVPVWLQPLLWPALKCIGFLLLAGCTQPAAPLVPEHSVSNRTIIEAAPDIKESPVFVSSNTPTRLAYSITPSFTPLTTLSSTKELPTSTKTPLVTQTATPKTALALRISFLTGTTIEDNSSLGSLSHLGLLAAAQDHGFEYVMSLALYPEAAIMDRVAAGDDVIVTLGDSLAENTRKAAALYSNVVFIGVLQPEAESVPDLIILGGKKSRQDQIGFIAGAMAGLQTETRVVGSVVPSGEASGLKYANGFLHGVRLTCGQCDVWSIDLEEYADVSEGSSAAHRLRNINVDTVFAAPGTAGDAAIRAAALSGVSVIGVGQDYYAKLYTSDGVDGADLVLGSIIYRPDVLLDAILQDLVSGKRSSGPIPFSFGSGTLDIIIPVGSPLSPAARDITSNIVSRIASGVLSTGVDPLSGEEQ